MKRWTALAGLAVLGVSATANAAVSDEEFQQMKLMLEQTLERLNQLEQQQAVVDTVQQAEIVVEEDQIVTVAGVEMATAEQVAANRAKLDKMSWADRISWFGDFRYRYEYLDAGAPVDATRNRQRIRARPAMSAALSPTLQVGFGLATGNDLDPISSNATLGGGGGDKQINVDLAYFDWTGITDTSIRAGKFKNTFQVVGGSELQWDGDWRPEGFDATWSNDTFFVQGLSTWLESDSNKSNNDWAYIVQAGAQGKLGPAKLKGGIGYTDITAKGKDCYYAQVDGLPSGTPSDGQLCYGNQATDNGATTPRQYLYDFNVIDVFAEATFEVGKLPLSIWGDYIQNADADEYDSGYQAGVQLGNAKEKGSWQLAYYYQDLESNATLGLLTNSDFGFGGTNGAGSVFSGAYAMTGNTNFAVRYYLVDRNTDKIATINNGQEVSADTLQLDLNFKYK